jgi:hypothetical protein
MLSRLCLTLEVNAASTFPPEVVMVMIIPGINVNPVDDVDTLVASSTAAV